VPEADTAIDPDWWLDQRRFPGQLRSFLDRLTDLWRERCLEVKRSNRIPVDTLATSISARRREELRDHLRPAILPVRGLALHTQSAEAEQQRLTREQYRILDSASSNPRLILTGSAGTGKTVLAVEQALRLAEGPPRRRVLFVCYSRALADHLAARFRDLPRCADVVVGTYHQVVMRLLAEAGIGGTVPEDWSEFNQALPDLLLSAMVRLGEERVRAYEALVVDEAQDLMHQSFFEALDLLLKGGLKSGRWLMGIDPSQAVFADQFATDLYAKMSSEYPVLNLTVNCRNTRQVAAYVQGLSGSGSISVKGADGPDVQLVYYATEQDHVKVLRSAINSLIGEPDRGLHTPEQVVVLTTERRAVPPSLWDTGALLRPLSEQLVPPPAGAIRVGTVHGFKGLEATCVVLAGLKRIDTAEARRLLYVGGSRAKGLLKIVLPKSSGPQVQACIADVLSALTAARVANAESLL
jgi:superfamily I DNA/RNA helicase